LTNGAVSVPASRVPCPGNTGICKSGLTFSSRIEGCAEWA
jgi:hypothetical protein